MLKYTFSTESFKSNLIIDTLLGRQILSIDYLKWKDNVELYMFYEGGISYIRVNLDNIISHKFLCFGGGIKSKYKQWLMYLCSTNNFRVFIFHITRSDCNFLKIENYINSLKYLSTINY